jgi:uncharacterized protein DUF6907
VTVETTSSTRKVSLVMSHDSTEVPTRPFWLFEPCPSWCDGLHEDGDGIADRRHHSRWGKRICLSTMDPCRAAFDLGDDAVRHEPCLINVRLEQGYREIEPRVVVEEVHGLGRFTLTMPETERLGKALAKAIELARGG